MYYWNNFFLAYFEFFQKTKKYIHTRENFLLYNDNEFFPQEKTVTKTERSYIIIPPK